MTEDEWTELEDICYRSCRGHGMSDSEIDLVQKAWDSDRARYCRVSHAGRRRAQAEVNPFAS